MKTYRITVKGITVDLVVKADRIDYEPDIIEFYNNNELIAIISRTEFISILVQE